MDSIKTGSSLTEFAPDKPVARFHPDSPYMGMAVTGITPEAITIAVPPIWETHKSLTSQ